MEDPEDIKDEMFCRQVQDFVDANYHWLPTCAEDAWSRPTAIEGDILPIVDANTSFARVTNFLVYHRGRWVFGDHRFPIGI